MVYLICLLYSKLLENQVLVEILVKLNKTLNKYNLLPAGDSNINTLTSTSDSSNKPRSFYKSHRFVTGLSDCHKYFVGILRTSLQKLSPKYVTYRKPKKLPS